MALSQPLAAIVCPASANANVGIQGRLNGLLINSFKPQAACENERYLDEDTNPDTMIQHSHSLKFQIEADKKSRTIDLGGANLGAALPLADMPLISNGNRMGFPITASGDYAPGYFILTERDDTTARGKYDTISLTLEYWGWKMPRFAA